MNRCLAIVLLCVPLLAACASREMQKVTPGARVIYHGGKFAVFTICDRGNRVYMTEDSDQVTVIPGGCPDGQP